MENNILAFLTSSLTDEENINRYSNVTAEEMKQSLDDAKNEFFKWCDEIHDPEESMNAFVIVGEYTAAIERNAYYNGFKAGLKLAYESLQ